MLIITKKTEASCVAVGMKTYFALRTCQINFGKACDSAASRMRSNCHGDHPQLASTLQRNTFA